MKQFDEQPGFQRRFDEWAAQFRTQTAQMGLLTAAPEATALCWQGKMLRARLTLRLLEAGGAAPSDAYCAARAVELLHNATLLHDDLVDGAQARRGRPAMWVAHGPALAVLLGDTLFFSALRALEQAPEQQRRLFLKLAEEVCAVEAECEILPRPATWTAAQHIQVARRKTGALFAFAAQAAAQAPAVAEALLESGYDLGTVYQLSDDLLDRYGAPGQSGKTLRLDAQKYPRSPLIETPAQAPQAMAGLLTSARQRLTPWPAVQAAWDQYVELDLRPALFSLAALPEAQGGS